MRGLKVGDEAPDFTLRNQDGNPVSLHDYRGKSSVVLYFYPKDFTRGCTAETIAFGENCQGLKDLGAEVLGVSSDTAESHKEFAAECRAGFPMLSDQGGKVRTLYSVPSSLGLIPGRVTYIIDNQGVVRHIFSSQIQVKKHVSEALRALKDIPSNALPR